MNWQTLEKQLRELDTTCLADVDKNLRIMDPGIRPLGSDLKLIGRARTVRCREDFFPVLLALAQAVAGDVLVIDSQGSRRAVAGELFSIEAQRRGLAGIVIDGGCRDSAVIRTLSMPCYARFTTPVAGTTVACGEHQIPVSCGGVTVAPGEILFGDEDGIIVLREKELEAHLPAALGIQAQENEVMEKLLRGESLIDLLNVEEHRARLQAGDRDTRLQFR